MIYSGSPNKKRRVEKDEVMDGDDDDDDMDVEPEEHLEMQKPQDMDSPHASQQSELFIGELI